MPELYIYEAIKAYGFNYAQAREIADSMDGQAGKTFLSGVHRITKDRTHFILEVLANRGELKAITVKKDTKILSIDTFDIEFSTDDPVSYTHLDVYKRQLVLF